MIDRPNPPSPTARDLSALLPLGGVVMTVGALSDDWAAALEGNATPHGRLIAVDSAEAETKGLDDVAEREKLLDLHLLVIGPMADAGRVIAHAGRVIGIFEPAIALIGAPTLHDSLLEDIGYGRHPLPSGLMTLLPAD